MLSLHRLSCLRSCLLVADPFAAQGDGDVERHLTVRSGDTAAPPPAAAPPAAPGTSRHRLGSCSGGDDQHPKPHRQPSCSRSKPLLQSLEPGGERWKLPCQPFIIKVKARGT